MRKFINKELITKELNIKVKNIKSMTWDELSNWAQVWSAIVGVVTFVSLIATVWITLKASTEKDEKARQQEQRVAEINLKVEEEARKRVEAERALLELQEKLRHRRLTEAQKANLQNHLRNAPKGAITVLSDNNIEAKEYAKDWTDVMQGAEWIVNGGGGGVNVSVAPLETFNNLDILIQIRDDTPQAAALKKALTSEGINIPFFANPKRENDQIVLVVATKR